MAEERSKSSTKVSKEEVRVNRSIPATKPLPAVKVWHPLQGFIDFVREQGVVGLGVAFVVANAAQTVIKSVVTNILTPLIGVATGGYDFSKKTVCLNSVAGVCKNTINYGQVISDFITFFVILAFVYFIVKRLKFESLDKKKDE